MAHMHFRVTTYKSGGTAAAGRVAYITRQPVHALSKADQQLRYIQEGREDLVYTRSRNLPAWADTAHAYFQAAERYERSGGVAFTEMKISLPQELSHRDNMALMHDLVDALAVDTLPVVYAFHDPTTTDGTQRQPHLHLVISARKTDAHLRTAETHFKRFNRAEPWRGGAEKDPASWTMGAVRAQRVMVSDVINAHLAWQGSAARIDPRTLADRHLSRAPEPKLLPSESRDYRERGIVSTNVQKVLEIRALRTSMLEHEQADAQAYWAGRKVELGIGDNMDLPEQLARIKADHTQAITRVPERRSVRELGAERRALEQSISALQTYSTKLTQERVIESRYREDYQRPQRGQRRAERLLAQGKEHGLPADPGAERAVARFAHLLGSLEPDEPQAGAGLRIRLFDREHEQDRGMGW